MRLFRNFKLAELRALTAALTLGVANTAMAQLPCSYYRQQGQASAAAAAQANAVAVSVPTPNDAAIHRQAARVCLNAAAQSDLQNTVCRGNPSATQPLGGMQGSDPNMVRLFARLDRKGPPSDPEPATLLVTPSPGANWTNSLGMRFKPIPGARSPAGSWLRRVLGMKLKPVPGTSVLFSIWDTRVEDFEKFVGDSGYDATDGMYSLRSDGWKQRGDTWKSPGFEQGPTYPVSGVSWEDAEAFCQWLTQKERGKGLLGDNQSYRLPTDAEWSAAAGNGKYPWGNQWPPPAGAGNYAGSEAADGNWPGDFGSIAGYQDGFATTSPVGSFTANRYGSFDMGGNLWQWCEGWYRGGRQYRVLRGASWSCRDRSIALSAYRGWVMPGVRLGNNGFRCVLVAGGGAR